MFRFQWFNKINKLHKKTASQTFPADNQHWHEKYEEKTKKVL